MNIFVLDKDPQKAAQMLCDKHVVKMCLETAQILCTMLSKRGYKTPYKPTHSNHPCVIWAGANPLNAYWLLLHGYAIGEEYTYRYGKIHKSHAVIEYLASFVGLGRHSDKPITPPKTFALAMPEQYKTSDPVESYRAYYIGEKLKIAKWTKREKPVWI